MWSITEGLNREDGTVGEYCSVERRASYYLEYVCVYLCALMCGMSHSSLAQICSIQKRLKMFLCGPVFVSIDFCVCICVFVCVCVRDISTVSD